LNHSNSKSVSFNDSSDPSTFFALNFDKKLAVE
jgi:hypothetical protein